MRRLPAIHFVANLALGVVHQNLSLAAFNKHDKEGNKYNQSQNKQEGGNRHRTVIDKLHRATDRARQASNNAREDDERDAVTNAALSDLLTEPH